MASFRYRDTNRYSYNLLCAGGAAWGLAGRDLERAHQPHCRTAGADQTGAEPALCAPEHQKTVIRGQNRLSVPPNIRSITVIPVFVFSVIALVFYLPVFCCARPGRGIGAQ